MAFVPVPNCALFALRGTLHGAEWVNTLAFRAAQDFSPNALEDVANQLEAWWASQVAPQLSSDCVLNEIYGLSLESNVAPSLLRSVVGGAIAGGLNNPALPGSVALTVSFRTLARGRSGRGRNYVSGLCEVDVTGNAVSAPRAEALRVAYQNLLTAVDPFTYIWVVISRQQDNVKLPVGVSRPVTSVVMVDNRVDSMRRRLR